MDAGAEAFDGFGGLHIAPHIAMTGTHGVADGHINYGNKNTRRHRITMNLPAADGDFDGGGGAGLRDDTLGAFCDRFYVDVLLAVPVLDGADTDRAGDAENVIAVTEGEEGVVGVPMALREFELGRAFAIGVYRLLFIEIDPVGHELGLNGYAVVVEGMVGVAFADIVGQGVGPFGDGITVADFGAFGEDGVARADRIRGGADTPERGGYSRGAPHE